MSRAARGERLQMRFALQVRTPGEGGLAGGVRARLRHLVHGGARRRALDLRQAGQGPAGAGLLPDRARRALARRRRAHRPPLAGDVDDLPPGRPAPDLRHDLRAGALGVLPAPGAAVRYEIPVRNAGRSAAGAAELTLQAAGRVLTGAIPALAAGAETTLQIRGPACAPGSTAVLTLDPTGRVDEADEADDRRVIPCPPRVTAVTRQGSRLRGP